MLPPDTPELAHCHATLLPIWELWTDGDPAMCQALDCQSADPAGRRVVRERLLARAQYLLDREDDRAPERRTATGPQPAAPPPSRSHVGRDQPVSDHGRSRRGRR
jgi:hypothetical protein